MSPNNYTARQQAVDGIDTVQLADAARHIEVSIAVEVEREEVRMPVTTLLLTGIAVGSLLQAVTQVIRNAILASPKDEQVSCRVRADARHVSFEVQDSGAGIPNEIQDRLGEPFFTTREPGQGMGLGLFIARSLVGHLGGALDIESAPGRGTRVEIQIPLGAGT